MSKALEQVIAEQQKTIDGLKASIDAANRGAAQSFQRHEELFEAWARFLDADLPTQEQRDSGHSVFQIYADLRHEVRMQMMESGYCLRCYNFVCECDYD